MRQLNSLEFRQTLTDLGAICTLLSYPTPHSSYVQRQMGWEGCWGVRARENQTLSIWTKYLFHRFGNQRNDTGASTGAVRKIPAKLIPSSVVVYLVCLLGPTWFRCPPRNIWFYWATDWDLDFSGFVSSTLILGSSPLAGGKKGFRDEEAGATNNFPVTKGLSFLSWPAPFWVGRLRVRGPGAWALPEHGSPMGQGALCR